MDFDSVEDAFDWLNNKADDSCIDNERFSFVHDYRAMAEYDRREANGCCGSLDEDITIRGVPAKIGLNYGH